MNEGPRRNGRIGVAKMPHFRTDPFFQHARLRSRFGHLLIVIGLKTGDANPAQAYGRLGGQPAGLGDESKRIGSTFELESERRRRIVRSRQD